MCMDVQRHSTGAQDMHTHTPGSALQDTQAFGGADQGCTGCIPACGCVSPALHQGALVLPGGRRHGGGRVRFCDGHLFGLGDLLPTVGTVAGIIDSRGTVFVKAVRDAALRLALHKITLETGG